MTGTHDEETRALVECAIAIGSVRIFQLRFTSTRLIITEIAKKHWGWGCLGPFSFIGTIRLRKTVGAKRRQCAALTISELLERHPDSDVFTSDQIKSISPDLQFIFTDGTRRKYLLSDLVKDPLLTQGKAAVAKEIERFLRSKGKA